jgi:hypothetical protein
MEHKFDMFTAIIWQPALPEEPVSTELVGEIIRTCVTGRFFPEDWIFRADLDRKNPAKATSRSRQKDAGPSWQIEDAVASRPLADALVQAPGEHGESSPNFVQSQVLEEYAELNAQILAGSYVDLGTAKRIAGHEFGDVLRFMGRNSQFRTLLVDFADRSNFAPEDWMLLGSLDLEVHFVRKRRIRAEDGHSTKKRHQLAS